MNVVCYDVFKNKCFSFSAVDLLVQVCLITF